jgi:hypothetical protein
MDGSMSGVGKRSLLATAPNLDSTEEPWLYEDELIRTLSLPLNLEGNRSQPFWSELSRFRAAAKEQARSKPIVPD